MTGFDGLIIAGVTCSGKTEILAELSQNWNIGVVNADAATIYRQLNIGTSKPSIKARKSIPHYLFDIINPNEHYDVRQYITDTDAAIVDCLNNHRLPIVSGGTIFYVKALLQGIHHLPTSNPTLREKLTLCYQKDDGVTLHNQLAAKDKTAADRIPRQNKNRLIRAIELVTLSQKTLAELYQPNQRIQSQHRLQLIALTVTDRKQLHQRVSNRFHKMLAEGLLAEVEQILKDYPNFEYMVSGKLIGYRQMIAHIKGKIGYQTMCQQAITATMGLAKRQMTWLNNWQGQIHRIQAHNDSDWLSPRAIATEIQQMIDRQL